MSERSTGEQPGDEWPPEWVEDGARLGVDPVVWATTSGGAVYFAVWRAFPDATTFEHGWAVAQTSGKDWLPMPADGVARVIALREARRERLDLSADDWQGCVRLVWPTLSEHERQNPQGILTAIAVLRPRDDKAIADRPRGLSGEAAAGLAPRKPGRPAWTRELFEEHWDRAYSLTKKPKTIARVAARFEALDGYSEVAPKTLSRLRHRYDQGELPE